MRQKRQELIDRILSAASRGPQPSPSTDCPDEQEMAAYLKGALPAENAKHVEDHLADCDACRFLVAEVRLAQDEIDTAPVELPLDLREDLKKRHTGRETAGITEFIVRVAQGIIERVADSGMIEVLEPLPVRGGQKAKTYRVVLSGYTINVAVDREENGGLEIWLKLEQNLSDQGRCDWSLWNEECLFEQQPVEKGEVLFSNVPPGLYRCTLRIAGRDVGAVDLHLKET